MELFSFIFFVHSHLKYKINNHYPCELMSLQNVIQITDAYPLPHVAYLGGSTNEDVKDRLTLCVTNPEKMVV